MRRPCSIKLSDLLKSVRVPPPSYLRAIRSARRYDGQYRGERLKSGTLLTLSNILGGLQRDILLYKGDTKEALLPRQIEDLKSPTLFPNWGQIWK